VPHDNKRQAGDTHSEQAGPLSPSTWRLRTRLVIGLLLVFVPVAALVVYTHLEDLQDSHDARAESYAAIGETTASVVDGFAHDIETLTLSAGQRYSHDGLTSQSLRADTAAFQSSQSFLAGLSRDHGNLRTIFITDTNGVVISDATNTDIGTDLSSREYITALKNGQQSVWSGVFSGAPSGEAQIAHGRVIEGPDGAPAMFIIAAFNPDRLAIGVPQNLPGGSNVALLDQTGQVLFSSGSSPDGGPQSLSSWRAFRNARRGEHVVLSGDNHPLFGGESYGSVVPVERPGWVVSLTVPASALDGPLQDQLLRDLGIIALVVLVGIVIMYLVALRLSQPLTVLANSAGAIARGERPVIPVGSADADVRKLEVAMDTMSRAVADRTERLSEQAKLFATLEQAGSTIASDLDFTTTVQAITAAGMRLTEAQNGAFFHRDRPDAPPKLFISHSAMDEPIDIGQEDFARLTAGFQRPGKAALRLADTTRAQYTGEVSGLFRGRTNANTQPPRSLLAVPIFNGERETIGGLIFGHPGVGAFTESHEKLALGIASWASIALDNSRLYSEAKETQEELRLANRAKDDFLGIVAHELRTPITTIYGGARLLGSRRAQLDSESANELISDIEQESERLYRLIQNLLVLARTESKTVQVQREPVAVNHMMQKLLGTFSRRRANRIVQINVDPQVQVVLAEETYLEQILLNLLTNADKYSPPDQPIHIDVRAEGGECVFRVMDRGPGVPESEIEKIFQSFYRSNATADRARGTGVGLAVCRRLVDAQGGRIWPSLREGGGLEIAFSLPLPAAVAPAELEAPARG
jgi:signal transduction histidine kinase